MQTTDNTQAAARTLDTLRELFRPHLTINKARLTYFVMLVLAIIKERTVSLVWLAQNADSDVKDDPIYRKRPKIEYLPLCGSACKNAGSCPRHQECFMCQARMART